MNTEDLGLRRDDYVIPKQVAKLLCDSFFYLKKKRKENVPVLHGHAIRVIRTNICKPQF